MIKIATCLSFLFTLGSHAQTVRAVAAGPVTISGLGGSTSVAAGTGAGNNTFTGPNNAFAGFYAGSQEADLGDNVYLGFASGAVSASGSNVFVGSGTASNSPTLGRNAAIGANAGAALTSGGGNTFVGTNSGSAVTSRPWNTFIGFNAGASTVSSSNIVIGANTTGPTTGDRMLFIDNSANNPLVWGDFANDRIKLHGKTGIGGNSTTSFGSFSGTFPSTANGVSVSAYQLFAKGGILTEAVTISTFSGWADYVFSNGYELMPLSEIEAFIAVNGHLPGVPSAREIGDCGFELGDMARIHQEKIEELTLHAIDLEKELERFEEILPLQSNDLDALTLQSSGQTKRLAELEVQVNALINAKPN